MSLWTPIVRPITSAFDRMARERVARELQRQMAEANPPAKRSSRPDPLYPWQGSRQVRRVAVEMDLLAAKRDCLEMYMNDPRIGAGLDGIGEDACQTDNEGFAFLLTNRRMLEGEAGTRTNPQTQRKERTAEQLAIDAVYDEISDRLVNIGLHEMLPEAITWSLVEADHFLEVIWDLDRGEVVGLAPVPGIREGFVMRTLHDPETNRTIGWGMFDVGSMERVREFAPWQVLPLIWHGRIPLMVSARLSWRMLKENEEDLYAGRKNRAVPWVHHTMEDRSTEQILEFLAEMDKLKRQREAEGLMGADTASNTKSELMDPDNAAITNVDDLVYREKHILTALRKPKALLAGYGSEGINRDTLQEQVSGYLRFLSRVDTMAARPIRTLINTMIAAKGLSPADYPFRLKWTDKNPRKFTDLVNALAVLRTAAPTLSEQSVLSEAGFDWEEEYDRTEYEAQLTGDPVESRIDREMGGMDDGGRQSVVDRILAALGGKESSPPAGGNRLNGTGTR